MMKQGNEGYTAVGLLVVLVWLVGLVGWVWNIVRMVGYIGDPLTVEFAIRAVGVFLAPLGAVLGYIPF